MVKKCVEQAVQPEQTRANGVIWNCDCAGEMV